MCLLDKKLVYLNKFLKKNIFDKKKAAAYLDITERHLTRLLQRWDKEGVINYFQGRGRGNHSVIQFNIDVEEELLNRFMRNSENHSLEEVRDILKLPISTNAQQIIKATLENKLFRRKTPNTIRGETFMDYYPKLPNLSEEKIKCDFSIMTLTLNTMNRLYEINDRGELINGVVQYDEWQGNILVIYLRKDVQFYNGQNLCANIVIKNLERVLEYKNMMKLKKYILSIDAISAFKFSITMTKRFDVIKYILSRLDMSLFLIQDDQLLTTGPYYINQYDNDTIYLKQNPYYFGETNDINQIEITSDPNKYSQYVQENALSNIPLEENLIMTYVIMNPGSDVFNIDQRRSLRNIILQFLSAVGYRHNEKIYSSVPQTISLNFKRPLEIIVDDDVPETYQLVEYLNNCGIPAISIPIHEAGHNGDIYLGKAFTEKLFFFNMLIFEPFGEWFTQLREAGKLLNQYKNNQPNQWKKAEKSFESWVYEHALYIPASKNIRHVNVPEKYTNINGIEYSIVKFNQFLIQGEYHHDR